MKGIRSIEVTFSALVELTQQDQQDIVAILSRICNRYESENPHRVMWPFGIGMKMTVNPLMLSDDEPIPFDDEVFSVECAERANYDWPCEACGKKQDEHNHLTVDPAAGKCEYKPASKLQGHPAGGSA